MPQAAIVALLRHSIGLNPEAIGPEVIARAVRHRMVQCASDLQTYLERIQTSEQELHALIDEVVVPETWFFRDQMPFAYLGRYVMAEWLPTHQHAVFRVLSLACSTGEEPYSIAMALLDSGLAPQHVRIDAVDISHQALRQRGGRVREPFLSWQRPAVSGALLRAEPAGVSHLRTHPGHGHVQARQRPGRTC